MDITKRIPLLFFLLLIVLSACRAQSTPVQPPLAATDSVQPALTLDLEQLPATDAEVPRVSVEEAKVALENGAAVLVDVRSPEAFASRHIAGAINVPLGDIEMNLDGVTLGKDQWIITYCT